MAARVNSLQPTSKPANEPNKELMVWLGNIATHPSSAAAPANSRQEPSPPQATNDNNSANISPELDDLTKATKNLSEQLAAQSHEMQKFSLLSRQCSEDVSIGGETEETAGRASAATDQFLGSTGTSRGLEQAA